MCGLYVNCIKAYSYSIFLSSYSFRYYRDILSQFLNKHVDLLFVFYSGKCLYLEPFYFPCLLRQNALLHDVSEHNFSLLTSRLQFFLYDIAKRKYSKIN